MSELILSGEIIKVGDLQTFDSGFVKKEFVIKTEGDYPQEVKFDVVKEAAEKFDEYNKMGDQVEVKFNVRGNEYEGKHYVNLSAWRIDKVAESTGDVHPSEEDVAQPEPATEGNEGLPF